MAGLAALAQAEGLSFDAFLGQAALIVHGTTVTTNAAPLVHASFRASHAGPARVDNALHQSDGSHLTELWRQRQPWYPVGDIDLLDRFMVDALKAGARAVEGHAVVARYVMETQLPLVRCPVLVIAPTADPHAYPSARRLADSLADSRYVELDGGMVPLPDQMPERFAELVTDFLLSVGKRSA